MNIRTKSNSIARRRGRSSGLRHNLVSRDMLTTAAVSILGRNIGRSADTSAGSATYCRTRKVSRAGQWRSKRRRNEPPRSSRVGWITHELHRARLPLEIYPVSAGVKGGLAEA